MKSLIALKDTEHIEGGISYPQSIEIRSVNTVRALGTDGEYPICTVTLEDGKPFVRVAVGISVGTLVPEEGDGVTMTFAEAEELASVLEAARNALHVHSLGDALYPSARLSQDAADKIKRRIDRVLHG